MRGNLTGKVNKCEHNKHESVFLRWAGVRKEYDDSSLMYKYVTEDESRYLKKETTCRKSSSNIHLIAGQKSRQLKLPVQN